MISGRFATAQGSSDKPNEDWVGMSASAVVVLDGLSSGPGPAQAEGTGAACVHGTPWFVAQLGARLLAFCANETKSLALCLREAISAVVELHSETCDVLSPNAPTATVAVVRIASTGDRVEYLVLADAAIIIGGPNGEATVLTDERVEAVAKEQKEAVLRAQIGTPEHDAAIAELISIQKPLRNSSHGYWVAGADPNVADEAISGQLVLRPGDSIAAVTDGVSRLVDLFGKATWAGLLSRLSSDGPDAILAQVRELEMNDPVGKRWPRYKMSDDATAAVLSIS
ncbi:protein phosphatase 2C domain-containing protein [Pseudonocardia sp. N23]|uniref:protein phosphatase 2C domain-containing protein n=1 Tax=Pseudonocardia sp. N23 TaxID=1987376 RepID=UPI000BFE2E94|nr:protein phosphatase 2C domain-containing protein [Pseudonocardia sp. N23]